MLYLLFRRRLQRARLLQFVDVAGVLGAVKFGHDYSPATGGVVLGVSWLLGSLLIWKFYRGKFRLPLEDQGVLDHPFDHQ